MLDLSAHRIDPMKDTDWYYDYERKMGHEQFQKYVNRIYGVLIELHEGESFSIVRHVAPENYDLFVKIGCLFINEMKYENFEFNSTFTAIRRIKS